MNILSITNDKLLSNEEWKSIYGTNLHEKMLLNRFVVRNFIDISSILDWLKHNCNSFYYHTTAIALKRDEFRVYILNDADVVNFKMRWDGHEEEEEPENIPAMGILKAKGMMNILEHQQWNSKSEGNSNEDKSYDRAAEDMIDRIKNIWKLE
jgi:hypothetical protein